MDDTCIVCINNPSLYDIKADLYDIKARNLLDIEACFSDIRIGIFCLQLIIKGLLA